MTRTSIPVKPIASLKRCAGITMLEMMIGMTLATVMLSSLFVLYYGAAKGASRDDSRAVVSREARLIVHRLSRDLKLVGLIAFNDANGDTNDIRRDVPNQPWSDSLRDDFEFANTYEVVFTGDVDNDGKTETVSYKLDNTHHRITETVWEWSRDSVHWSSATNVRVGSHVDYLMFVYYDKDGKTIPDPVTYPAGGLSLSSGERKRITAVEVTTVTRSELAETGYSQYVHTPDGAYWYDGYRREIYRFLVRGRNLSLGA
jgi:hypothetical protein